MDFVDGYPTAETAGKLYDELDDQRALQAYFGAVPLVKSVAHTKRRVWQHRSWCRSSLRRLPANTGLFRPAGLAVSVMWKAAIPVRPHSRHRAATWTL